MQSVASQQLFVWSAEMESRGRLRREGCSVLCALPPTRKAGQDPAHSKRGAAETLLGEFTWHAESKEAAPRGKQQLFKNEDWGYRYVSQYYLIASCLTDGTTTSLQEGPERGEDEALSGGNPQRQRDSGCIF